MTQLQREKDALVKSMQALTSLPIDISRLERERQAVINAPENRHLRSLLVSPDISIYRINNDDPRFYSTHDSKVSFR